jgi:hypothetical protein
VTSISSSASSALRGAASWEDEIACSDPLGRKHEAGRHLRAVGERAAVPIEQPGRSGRELAGVALAS